MAWRKRVQLITSPPPLLFSLFYLTNRCLLYIYSMSKTKRSGPSLQWKAPRSTNMALKNKQTDILLLYVRSILLNLLQDSYQPQETLRINLTNKTGTWCYDRDTFRMSLDDIICLDVGGTRFDTTRSTLLKVRTHFFDAVYRDNL